MEASIDVCVSADAWTDDTFNALEKLVVSTPENSSALVDCIFSPLVTQSTNLREYWMKWHISCAVSFMEHQQKDAAFCAVRNVFGQARDISPLSNSTRFMSLATRLLLTSTFNGRIIRDFVSVAKKQDVAAFENKISPTIRAKFASLKPCSCLHAHQRNLSDVFELAPLHWNFVDRLLRARTAPSFCNIAVQYCAWMEATHVYMPFTATPSLADSVWWFITIATGSTLAALRLLVDFYKQHPEIESVEIDSKYFQHWETLARKWADDLSKKIMKTKDIYVNFVESMYQVRLRLCYCQRRIFCSLYVTGRALSPQEEAALSQFNANIVRAFSDIRIPRIYQVQRFFCGIDRFMFFRFSDERNCLICLNALPDLQPFHSTCPRMLHCKDSLLCCECAPAYLTCDLKQCPVCKAPIEDVKKLM